MGKYDTLGLLSFVIIQGAFNLYVGLSNKRHAALQVARLDDKIDAVRYDVSSLGCDLRNYKSDGMPGYRMPLYDENE